MRSDNQNFADDKSNADAKIMNSMNSINSVNSIATNQKMGSMKSTAAEKYADIINLPHHVSKRHPRMALSDRAAQFGSYAALRGYSTAVKETVEESIRQTEHYIETEQYDDE